MLDLIRAWLEDEHLLWEVLERTTSHIDFRPRNWRHWLRRLGRDGSNRWIYLRADDEGRYFVDVEEMREQHRDLRKEIVRELRQQAPACGFERHRYADEDQVTDAQLRVTGTEQFGKDTASTLRDLFLKVERLGAFLPPDDSAVCSTAESFLDYLRSKQG